MDVFDFEPNEVLKGRNVSFNLSKNRSSESNYTHLNVKDTEDLL